MKHKHRVTTRRRTKLRRLKETENNESCKFAAAANLERANSDVERKVIECFGALEIAELNFTAGQEFGRAVLEMRDEMKKNGNRNFMKRLEELEVSYAKARYWMAIVEGIPINRGKKKNDASPKEAPAPGQKQKLDWKEDWDATTARFREAADAARMLVERQPERRESFIGELKNLAEVLGYELRPKRRELGGVLQRVRPDGGGMAA